MFRRVLGLMLVISAGLAAIAAAQVQTKESQAAMTDARDPAHGRLARRILRGLGGPLAQLVRASAF